MMALYFISLGLFDERDISLKGLEVAKSCDLLFWEPYTQPLETTKEKLEKLIGKEITVLTRKDVEENYKATLLEPAKTKKVGLLIGGDVFCATTHAMLRLEAMKQGIETKVIHASSVFSAVAETGLHIYKFGATATIPMPERTGGALPESVYGTIKKNLDNGYHTLLLLDIDVENNKFLSVKEALKTLLKLEENKKQGLFNENTKVIVASKLGSENTRIVYGTIKKLLTLDFEIPCVVVVPSKLHFTEEEYLKFFEVD